MQYTSGAELIINGIIERDNIPIKENFEVGKFNYYIFYNFPCKCFDYTSVSNHAIAGINYFTKENAEHIVNKLNGGR